MRTCTRGRLWRARKLRTLLPRTAALRRALLSACACVVVAQAFFASLSITWQHLLSQPDAAIGLRTLPTRLQPPPPSSDTSRPSPFAAIAASQPLPIVTPVLASLPPAHGSGRGGGGSSGAGS
eukprot:5697210-Prymnesium_polylepis.1